MEEEVVTLATLCQGGWELEAVKRNQGLPATVGEGGYPDLGLKPLVLWVCERCGTARMLVVKIDGTLLCAECWKAWGSLWWSWPVVSPEDLALREIGGRNP